MTKIWNFTNDRGLKILIQPQTSRNSTNQQKNNLEYQKSHVRNDNVQKVVKLWNFTKDRGQNFQFLKILTQHFKSTKEHFRILFWSLQFTHKSEITMFKKWSKSEISLRTAVIKIFNFWQIFDQPQTSRNSSNQQKNTLEYHFQTCNHSQVKNDNVQKVVKIGNFAKDRGHENFQFFTKF